MNENQERLKRVAERKMQKVKVFSDCISVLSILNEPIPAVLYDEMSKATLESEKAMKELLG